MEMKSKNTSKDKEKEKAEEKRRKFLKAASKLAISIGLTSPAIPFLVKGENKKNSKDEGNKSGKEKKVKWGMVIDLDLCTGCGACVVACKVENNIPITGYEKKDWGTEIEWMTLIPYPLEEGEEKTHQFLIPIPCLHCDNPPCTKVCPVNATYINEEGLVAQIYDRCIGCRYCQVACPYSRKYFTWEKPEFPETYVQALNPDVPVRPKGVVEKCTFCYHRIRKLKEKAKDEEREISDEELRKLPACAQACPTGAITFGNLADPDSLVSKLARSPRAFTLLPHLGTKPKVIYLSKFKQISLLEEVKGGSSENEE
jgi:molybdopterin-containing oxidoreductase family iron-sulfur binding subunit